MLASEAVLQLSSCREAEIAGATNADLAEMMVRTISVPLKLL